MTEPTDAEIWQMWMPMVRHMGVADPVEFARAVLAKWGTPAPVGVEPYGRVTTHSVTGQQFFYRWPESPYLDNASECVSVYTTPQPTQTQAGAVPLTHAQAKALVSRYGNDPLHLVYQVEVAHGIKGGQHGAE